ncbi:MAG: hypothetical protein MAG431_02308 [Chloroflexi bacterium]|nr:hypothetical protein [Chloroflexota bacterium]
MPRISYFFGIAIYMYYKEHGLPHFHAIYGQYDVPIGIDPIELLEGKLPSRVQSLVFEWTEEYQAELLANWELARANQPLRKIPPLT